MNKISMGVAILFAALGLIVLSHIDLAWNHLVLIFFMGITTLLISIDAEQQVLPELLCYVLLWGGLIVNLDDAIVPLDEAVLGAVWGYLLLWMVYWIFKAVSQKEGLGYGDFKLMAALGAWVGWGALPFLIMSASLLTVLFQSFTYFFYHRDLARPIAFGPSLILVSWGILSLECEKFF
jgi:leader peptidase (prepilin peptidase)/N-methyltransferase